jgi:hypothetical protein
LNTKLIVIVAAIGLGTGCLLPAADAPKLDEPNQKVELSRTERMDFPSGGTLRFKNSVGVLTVEAWDRPDVEITTIKSTRADVNARDHDKATRKLDRVKVATERHGDELLITTIFPGHRPFRLPYPLSGNTSFDLEYRVKAPASARIIAGHTLGQVNIDGLAGDIQVNLAQGEILLHLPEEQKYSIHAKSDFGSVNSDFPEPDKRTGLFLGHRSDDENSGAPHKLNLKVGFGDIVILGIRVPKSPEVTTPAQKKEGL